MNRKTVFFSAIVVPAAVALGWAGSAGSQPGPPQRCPPACEVILEVPSNPARPPKVSVETLAAAPGETIRFRPNRRILIVFPEDTPFVDDGNQPIYHFGVGGNRVGSYRVREDDQAPCQAPPGCKYLVIDDRNPNRPPLDPYVIIRP